MKNVMVSCLLNAYATTFESIGSHDARRRAGTAGISFTNAAAILGHAQAAGNEPEPITDVAK